MSALIFNTLQIDLPSLMTHVTELFATFGDYAYLSVAFVAAMAYLLARLIALYLPDLIKKTAEHFNVRLHKEVVGLLRFPLFNLTFMSGLFMAVHIATLSPALEFAAKAIIKSAMIAVVGVFIYRLLIIVLEHTAYKGRHGIIQLKTLPLFSNVAMVFVLVGASHQIFAVWDIDMTALLASAGIAGLAIGMAAKDMLADVIAGILILTDNPYNVGDVIQLGSGEEKIKGRVTRIGMRSTRLLTEYNVEVIMPNSQMAASRILNESSSAEKTGIVGMEIRTASNIDPKQIRSLFTQAILSHPEVLKDREIEILILDFDDRIVTWELVFHTPEADWEELIACAVRENIYQILHKAGIQFALPTEHDLAMLKMADSKQEIAITRLPDSRQDIHIKEMPNEARTVHIKEVPSLFGSGPVKSDVPGDQSSRQPRQRSTEPYRSISPGPLKTTGEAPRKDPPLSPSQETEHGGNQA